MSGAATPTFASAKAPLLRPSGASIACLAFMLGLLLGEAVAFLPAFGWLLLTAAAALSAPWLSPRAGRSLAVVAIVGMGAAWHDVRLERRPADSLALLLRADDPGLVRLEGVVAEEPQVGSAQRGRFARFAYQGIATRFTLVSQALVGREGERLPVSGRVWVSVDEAVYDLHAGDRVSLLGSFHALPDAANPGEPESGRAACQFDVVGRLSIASRANVQPAAGFLESGSGPWRAFTLARHRFRRSAAGWLFAGAFNSEDSQTRRAQALVSALVLGERSNEGEEVTAAFRRAGLAHLLSISGLHLAILAAVVAFAARCLTGSRRLEMLIVALAVLAYLFLVPARIPVVRASIMVLGFLAAEAAGRRYDRLSVLALIALALLIWRPLELWSAGFQLSFGIVAGLIALGEPFRLRVFGERPSPDTLRARDRVVEAFKTALAGSVLAWLLATPLVAYHFQTFCPLAPILGLLALPLAGAVLVLGYAKILTGALWPSLGEVLGPFLTFAAEMTAELALQIDKLPLASARVPPVSGRWLLLATVAVVYLVVHRRRQRRLAVALLVIAAAWLVLGSAPPREFRRGPDAAVRLDMLSVGDGACLILRTAEGALMWDCGSANLLSAGERIVVPALQALGVRRIEALFLSHPNLDHYDAVLAVVDAVPVGRVLVTPDFFARARAEPAGPVAFLRMELETRGIPLAQVTAGWAESGAGVRFTALHPPADASYDRINEGSIVLQVEVAGRTLLLTGDVQGEGLADLRRAHPDLACDVLEMPHHGSATEDAAAFLAALDPAVVLQSTGGRRDPSAFGTLVEGRAWFVTARDGAGWVEITREGEIRSGCYRAESQD
ncbi:MAG: DNA internalization-related competence protein ComEC/Rec2 [Phycisphaerales bacterium JB038]